MGKLIIGDGSFIKPEETIKLKPGQVVIHLAWNPNTGETQIDRDPQNRIPETPGEQKVELDNIYAGLLNALSSMIAHFMKNGKDREEIIQKVFSKVEEYVNRQGIKKSESKIVSINKDIRDNFITVLMSVIWEPQTGGISIRRTAFLPDPTTDGERAKEADDHLQCLVFCIGHFICFLGSLKVPKELLLGGMHVAVNKYLDQGLGVGETKSERLRVSLELEPAGKDNTPRPERIAPGPNNNEK